MTNSIIEGNQIRLCLIANVKDISQKRNILAHLPHSLSMLDIGLLGVIAEKNEKNQMTYRSVERIRLTELENNQVKIECEESSYFLSACAFLHDYGIEFNLDKNMTYLVEECKEVTIDNIDELLESMDCNNPRYIDESFFIST